MGCALFESPDNADDENDGHFERGRSGMARFDRIRMDGNPGGGQT